MNYSHWSIPSGKTIVPDSLTAAGYSPLLAAVLNARGMSCPAEAQQFLENDIELLGDPLLLKDMPHAVQRLTRAIMLKEKVAVYGDYDVDGITSSCMLTDYLQNQGLSCELYIPDRLEEGYGVNNAAIQALHERGVSLIITVDCGVTTMEEAEYASSIGVDMIITDHHECREGLPNAIAVVDPKRPDCNYPSHDLAGVGVAFKLLCALEGNADSVLSRYADLIAVGTIADVMPLVGENRYIVKRGLDKLASDPCPGLKALIDESGLGEKRISATNIGFTLAPRLNASGRLGQVDSATNLLLTKSPKKAAGYAADLCQLNRDRQALETDIWQQAQALLGTETPTLPIVLSSESWHQGVIGIAASRLAEAYSVPAIMICLDGDEGKGSCRSCPGFNLFEALNACSMYLEGFGGHALAAGMTIRRENIDAFRAALAEYYLSHPSAAEPTLELDVCVDSPKFLTMECVEDLSRIEPCGSGNPRPHLCLLGAQLTDIIPIGGGKHLRLHLTKYGQVYEAVYFQQTVETLSVHLGDYVDVAFYPQINEFRCRKNVQFLINDLRRHDVSGATAILSGCDIDAYLPFAPVRSDFEMLWRSISCRCTPSFSAPIERFCDQLCPCLREETICICLLVFEELGLIQLNYDGTMVETTINNLTAKVDLNGSKLLTRLRNAQNIPENT